MLSQNRAHFFSWLCTQPKQTFDPKVLIDITELTYHLLSVEVYFVISVTTKYSSLYYQYFLVSSDAQSMFDIEFQLSKYNALSAVSL